ncbi:MAG: iron ABC transporter substrate-binding protein [Firmicutes bacterium HGW-Firmicutes-1]|jgi:iron(III) transport system substrate-binding protein|nr:MAG: iron ABC transporter substrate-binding protein [Firmicutes bacterium HGW-Firmicutes-1]
MKNAIFVIICCIILAVIVVILAPKGKLIAQINKEETNSNTLVIYSPLNEEIIIPIVKEFQETTGIQITYLSAGTVDLLTLLERKGDKPLMDVLWGSSKEFIDSKLEYFQPYQTSYDSKIHKGFKHDRNDWNGFNLLPIVLMYNKKLVSPEEAPKSWEDLLDPKWKGKMVYTDPNNSGSSFMILSTLLSLGKEGNEYNWGNVRKFLNNVDGKIMAKSSEVYNGIANGDFALGLTMEEAAVRLIRNGADVEMVYLEEGTPVITDVIVLMKDAQNLENAKIFIDFVLSDHVQKYMVDYFYLRSIRTDITPPEGLISIEDLNILDSNSADIYRNKDEILHTFDQLLSK